MKSLDQFYTKKDLAKQCFNKVVLPTLTKLTQSSVEDLYFIEPSVGNGDFYDLLPSHNRLGIDIVTNRQEFLQTNFLTWHDERLKAKRQKRKNTVVIGNPPFGHRSKMAIDFFNKAAEHADVIAFVLPIVFKKFFIHKQLNKDFQWIKNYELPRKAFYTNQKKDYSVNTEFQVWTRLPNPYDNLRLSTPPPIKHEDFLMHQYNNTTEALKVFDNDFDFAVPSQGWQDYKRRETHPDKCEKNKQWILFKTKAKKIYERLYSEINFDDLALKSPTAIPGFRKNDVVLEYMNNYG